MLCSIRSIESEELQHCGFCSNRSIAASESLQHLEVLQHRKYCNIDSCSASKATSRRKRTRQTEQSVKGLPWLALGQRVQLVTQAG